MLKSLYAYRGTHSRTLAFNANEKFLEIGASKDPNWVHVINENGKLGYVPKNYMTLEQVSSVEMLEMIDACIEGIHLSASEKSGTYSKFEKEALQILVEKRQEWYNKIPPTMHPSKRPAPPPPCRTTSQLSVDSIGSNFSDGSLPSPCQPPPSSISTPIQATIPNAMSPPDSKATIRPPQRQSSEIEIVTSFIGRGNSLVSEEGNEIEVVQSPEIKEHIENSVPETPCSNMENILSTVPNGYCKYLVEDVRSKTNISFSTSQQVVTLILESLAQTFKPLSPLVQKILFDKHPNNNVDNDKNWESSSDGRKLVEILEKLRQCKDDGQQRSWALHEDEFTITELLNNLLDVLTNGDLGICSEVLMIEDFRPVLTLVQYYQMETRWSLRKLLLLIFTNICQISRKNISFLSASVLPLELTREILDPNISQEELQFTVLVLGMILSMGDTLPFTHFSIMNESFVSFLVEGVESYNSDPDTEHLGELFLTLLLAFNLQFYDASTSDQENGVKDGQLENLVIKVLSRKSEYKYFIEKILILFNREEDPVCMFEHEPRPVHSVLLMMVDIFQCAATAKLLYTNDEKVLCDIILRQLTDLSLDDKRRNNYLLLLEGVVSLGRWKEHQHRQKELASRLSAISEQGESPRDKQIALRILKEVQ